MFLSSLIQITMDLVLILQVYLGKSLIYLSIINCLFGIHAKHRFL